MINIIVKVPSLSPTLKWQGVNLAPTWGNRHSRKAMHLPSLSAVKHDENFKEVYIRLISKHGIKMKALIAIQRKLLELTYVLFKNKTKYDNEYKSNKRAQPMLAATL